MSSPVRMALVGLGKISVDEHIPALTADGAFALTGAMSPRSRVDGIETFDSLPALFAARDIDAVAINTPPQVRRQLARQALLAGKHVLLEKPPGATVAEVLELENLARERGLTLFTAWHSQYAPAVEPARAWLSGQSLRRVGVTWCEDVRQWHPGQTWIWKPGGLGVFDPGINALSILTRILPEAIVLERARLQLPGNCQTPITAELGGAVGAAGAFSARFDFLQTGTQTWSIEIETASGALSLTSGGAALCLDDTPQTLPPSAEYSALYRRFAELIEGGQSDVDVRPLGLVADAFLIGETIRVEDFHD